MGYKIVEFLGKRTLVLSSQCSIFVHKIENIVGIEEKKMGREKIMCLLFDPNWVYIRNKWPQTMTHGFSHGFIEKVGYHDVL